MVSEGYYDILYLIGLAFGKRDLIEVVERIGGIDELFKKVPHGDLNEEQKAAYRAAFEHPRVRAYVAQWWPLYDELRATDEIPGPQAWQPNNLE